MNLGPIGSPIVFVHKLRYFLSVDFPGGFLEPQMVRVAKRPSEDSKLFTVSYFEGDYDKEFLNKLYSYISSIFSENKDQIEIAEFVKNTSGELKLYDATDTELESWKFYNLLPRSISFGELDFSNSGLITIELEWKYSHYEYKSAFSQFPVNQEAVPIPSHD